MARRFRFSPAALILAQAGVTQREVADALGVSSAAVSLYLRGDRAGPPALVPVIRALAGSDAAEQIARLLPTQKVGECV